MQRHHGGDHREGDRRGQARDPIGDAKDDTLRDELDELRSVRSSKSAEDWAAQLDVVSYRCLQIYEEEQR